MKNLFIFHRDLRLYDNTTLIYADSHYQNIIPCFIFDPKQLYSRLASNNCIQFMVESLKELNVMLKKYNSRLHTYFGKPYEVVEKLVQSGDIENVFCNMDYTPYSKFRDDKIRKVCEDYHVNFISLEDCMLNNISTIKTTTGKHYEKFTPYYDNAVKHQINKPVEHKFKNLIKTYKSSIKEFKESELIYKKNPDIYIHGGRSNALKILKNIKSFVDYNEQKNYFAQDTTLLSAHNKFGTVSIREVYWTFRNALGRNSDLLRNLYWRDFYYNQMYFMPEYFEKTIGYKTWKTNKKLFEKWKLGKTGIPIVDAGMHQLNKTGWIHNRIRLLTSYALTKILKVDWRLGEEYFRKKLIDCDVSQNIGNWYWISSEAPFSNPSFRTMNIELQTKKYDPDSEYIKKWL